LYVDLSYVVALIKTNKLAHISPIGVQILSKFSKSLRASVMKTLEAHDQDPAGDFRLLIHDIGSKIVENYAILS